MSERAASETTDLETAIEQNPEAVAEFVEHLDAVNELLEVLSLETAALDDEMIRSLAGTGAAFGEVAQTASNDATRNGIETLLTSVGEADRDRQRSRGRQLAPGAT